MSDKAEDHRIDVEIHRRGDGSDPFAAAARATRMPMLITDPRQPDNPIIFVNDAFGRLTGYSREETLGRNCRFLQGPATNVADVGRIRDAVNARVPIEIDLLNYRKDGTTFWNRVLISPVFDNGELTYFFASQLDITRDRLALSRLSDDRSALEADIERRLADLAASEERLRFTLQAGGLGTWTLDVETTRLMTSVLCKAIYGRGPADGFTMEDLRAAIVSDDLPRWTDTVARSLATDGSINLEYRIRTPAGELRWVHVRGETRFNPHGEAVSVTGVVSDTTARKEDEAHRAMLTQELNHRVKNTLASVQSIVAQTLRQGVSVEQGRENIERRLHALSGAQEILMGAEWGLVEMDAIVRRALAPFIEAGHERITISGPALPLSPSSAQAMSLCLHEMATNAAKYGALSNDVGCVRVRWSADGDAVDFSWKEVDGPPVVPPTRRGFGSQLIERALVHAIGGQAKVEYASDGVCFTLRTTRDALIRGS